MDASLISGIFIGALASAFALIGVLTTSRWRIAEENIVKQRAQWRGDVRSLIAEAVTLNDADAARRVWAELALRLNPLDDPDKDDRELVDLVRGLEHPENRNDATRRRIVSLAAHILKHDWTRAKWETKGWLWEDEPEQRKFPFS